MAVIRDLRGLRFGRLTAIEPTPQRRHGGIVWRCMCDCGKEALVGAGPLYAKEIRSCGCLQKENALAANTRHGHSIGKYPSREYRSWTKMRARCCNPKTDCYHNYGGRGIAVCTRWSQFKNFLTDMGPRPPHTTLDRIDVNGNYEPSNCRWADWQTQARNQRPRINGATLYALLNPPEYGLSGC